MPRPNGVSRLKSRSLFVSHSGNLHSVVLKTPGRPLRRSVTRPGGLQETLTLLVGGDGETPPSQNHISRGSRAAPRKRCVRCYVNCRRPAARLPGPGRDDRVGRAVPRALAAAPEKSASAAFRIKVLPLSRLPSEAVPSAVIGETRDLSNALHRDAPECHKQRGLATKHKIDRRIIRLTGSCYFPAWKSLLCVSGSNCASVSRCDPAILHHRPKLKAGDYPPRSK